LNILFLHLLNNYSGSPQVLSNYLKELILIKKFKIYLLTSKTEGSLSNIPNIIYFNNHYKWSNNKLFLITRFLLSQIYIFFFVLFRTKNINILYINNILSFSAAIAGKLIRKKIIYHVHELYIHPNIFQKIMWSVMEKSADNIFSVSKYVSEHIKRKSINIYNTVSRKFEVKAKNMMIETKIINQKFSNKNILMVSSLKKYKGIDIFVSIAKQCPEYSFSLIISSMPDEIMNYFLNTRLPLNLKIIPVQNDLSSYYLETSLLLNLSLPKLCIEAFGMTLIEGMQFGTPCIAPNFGGPKEIIINGENGFLVDPYDENTVIQTINTILSSEDTYTKFFNNVMRLNNRFSIDTSINTLTNELNALYIANQKK
jgi:glycosyltransferase involved in cell wall biosynthesis